MSENAGAMSARNSAARRAGLLYLLFMATFVVASTLEAKVLVPDNAAATAATILASPLLVRIGFAGELLSAVLFVSAAWALYVLLRPVDKNVALLFLLLNAIGVAIECTSALGQLAALIVLTGNSNVAALPLSQAQPLASLLLNLHQYGFLVSNIFFAVWLFPLGLLVIRSGFLPKILGVLLYADGCSLLIMILQTLFFPDLTSIWLVLYPIMLVAELSLSLWLLIVGVRDTAIAASP